MTAALQAAVKIAWLEQRTGNSHAADHSHRIRRRGTLRIHAHTPTRALTAVAHCDPSTLVGYVYRDPRGFDLHVAQSDLASYEVQVRTRRHRLAPWGEPQRLSVAHGAALEFHQPEPLPGVRYIPW